MSSFSAEWLALREPADRAAQNTALLTAVAAAFAGRDSLSILDLGCGTGSTLRRCAPALPAHQEWALVDRDLVLLDTARAQLEAWGDTAEQRGDRLVLTKGHQTLSVAGSKGTRSIACKSNAALQTIQY